MLDKKYLKTNTATTLYIIAFFALIFMDIFNNTSYRADLEAVVIPLFFCCLFSLFIKRKIDTSFVIAIIFIGIFTAISTIASDVIKYAVGHLKFYIFLCSFICISTISLDKDAIKKILLFYIIVSLIASVYIVITYINGINLTLNNRATLVIFGVEKDQNYTGSFIVPGVILSLYSFIYSKGVCKKILYLLFTSIQIVAIFFTGSRGAFLSLVVAFIIFLLGFLNNKSINHNKKIIVIIVMLFALIICFILFRSTSLFERMFDKSGYTDNIRLLIWEYALEGFRKRPLIGSGLYSGSYYSQLHLKWVTHSSFIDILVSGGIIVSALWIFVFAKILKVKSINKWFMFSLFFAFFLPYMFINGYETLSFWLPLTIMCYLSKTCLINNYDELFNYKS